MNQIKEDKVRVKIKPGSEENKIINYDKKLGKYIISIKQPALKNKANKELIKFLKKKLKKQIKIISGLKSKEKLIEVK